MNLYIFNSKIVKNPVAQSLFVTLSFLTGYSLLGNFNILKSSEGFNQWQGNIVRLQKYAYDRHSQLNLVVVGSSLTANIPTDLIDKHVVNLGLNGGATQTGLEVAIRQNVKPKFLLVEINNTITRKIDKQVIESNYNPFLYNLRRYIPSFREEYKPSSQTILMLDEFRNKFKKPAKPVEQKINTKQTDSQQSTDERSSLSNTIVSQLIQSNSQPLSAQEKNLLTQEARYIKSQISTIERDGTHVILFNVPGDHRLENTLAVKQSRLLMKELFPVNNFEWLPEPPARKWLTGDGAHLIPADAKVYADFLKDRLQISAK
jgi:hypothetical protein